MSGARQWRTCARSPCSAVRWSDSHCESPKEDLAGRSETQLPGLPRFQGAQIVSALASAEDQERCQIQRKASSAYSEFQFPRQLQTRAIGERCRRSEFARQSRHKPSRTPAQRRSWKESCRTSDKSVLDKRAARRKIARISHRRLRAPSSHPAVPLVRQRAREASAARTKSFQTESAKSRRRMLPAAHDPHSPRRDARHRLRSRVRHGSSRIFR